MKKSILAFCLLASLATTLSAATPAPTNVSVGYYRQDGSADIFWDTPTAQVTQWYIYFNGTQSYNPTRTMVGMTSVARMKYVMQGIQPQALPVTITVKAFIDGSGLSAASSGVWLGGPSSVPVVYVTSPPDVPMSVSIVGGGGGAVTQGGPFAVSVLASAGAPIPVTLEATVLSGGSGNVDATTQRVVVASDQPRLGVSITSSVLFPVSITSGVQLPVSINAGTAFIGAVSVTAGTAVGVTLGAVTGNLKTSGTGVDALNAAISFDYDVNTKTANSRRGLDCTTSYYATSGTTAVTASGYTLLYGVTIFPSSVSNSNVYFFDGIVTKTALSATSAQNYSWPRGKAFSNGMTMTINGSSFDGGVTIDWAQ